MLFEKSHKLSDDESKYQKSESRGEILTVILGGKSRDYEGYNSRVKDIFT